MKQIFLFEISQFSVILKEIFVFWLLSESVFALKERKYFPPLYVAYDVFVNNCLVLRTPFTGTQIYSSQTLKEGKLDIWLVPSHDATWPPSSSVWIWSYFPPPRYWKAEVYAWNGSLDLFIKIISVLFLLLYKENKQWVSLLFSVIIPLVKDVLDDCGSPLSLKSPLKRRGGNIKNDRWGLQETHY